MGEIRELPIVDCAVDPANVRRRRGDLSDLEASIVEQGVLVPLIVRPDPDPTSPADWWVVDGGSRLEAAERAGLDTVPCQVVDDTDDEAFRRSLTVNVARRSMGPVEEAQAYAHALEAHGLTQLQLGHLVGVSQTMISQRLKLLQLDEATQRRVDAGELSVYAALQRIPKDPRRTIPHDYPAASRPRKAATDRRHVAANLSDLATRTGRATPSLAAPPGTTLVAIPNDVLTQAKVRAKGAGKPVGAWIVEVLTGRRRP